MGRGEGMKPHLYIVVAMTAAYGRIDLEAVILKSFRIGRPSLTRLLVSAFTAEA